MHNLVTLLSSNHFPHISNKCLWLSNLKWKSLQNQRNAMINSSDECACAEENCKTFITNLFYKKKLWFIWSKIDAFQTTLASFENNSFDGRQLWPSECNNLLWNLLKSMLF